MVRRTQLRLRKPLERHLRAGHPWIYADALERGSLPSGSVVDVLSPGGRFLARGLYDAASPIAVRVLTLDEDLEIGPELVEDRLARALALRQRIFDPSTTNAFRWLNGEGDLLAGLVVDVYAGTAVARVDGEGARPLLEWANAPLERLGRALGLVSCIERSRGETARLLWGELPQEAVEVRESGVRMAVDVVHGQKTGGFLDQRDNRLAIRPYAAGEEVANLFAYTGGFSLHAALAGARSVVSVDSAAPALIAARHNFTLNGIDPRDHRFDVEDAFAWLARARRQQRLFGLVVVDPPSFAPSERALTRALGAYRRLMAEALAVVRPDGILAASSCSSHVGLEPFLEVLGEAAAQASRRLAVLETRGQPADHPSLPAFSEGRYLKFVIARAE